MTTFTDLGISNDLVSNLGKHNILIPTEIQIKAIPFLLKSEKDFLGQSHTGTGKTLAFGLPLIQNVELRRSLQSIILCPTRELAQQISKQLMQVVPENLELRIVSVFGGEEIEKQIRIIDESDPEIIVGTPGRLIDLLKRGIINLHTLNYIILDEADEMLRRGFREDIDFIFSFLKRKINTWLFCATLNDDIKIVADKYLEKNFVHIDVSGELALNPDIEHQYMVCKPDQKREGLMYFLRLHKDKNGIVFCRTKAAADEIGSHLINHEFPAEIIHSDLSQKDRDQVINRFRRNEFRILVATDIAARGLDIKGLGFVVHYHLPEQREYFNHRCGRTGRAGEKGVSILIVFQKEVKKINAIANNLGLRFTKVEIESEGLEVNEGTFEKKLNTDPSMVMFYINLGKSDDVNRKNLVEFICAEAGLKQTDFGEIKVEKKRSYFQVKLTAIRKLNEGLKGLVVDGKHLVLTRAEL